MRRSALKDLKYVFVHEQVKSSRLNDFSKIDDFRNITRDDLIFNEIKRQVIENADEKFCKFLDKIDAKFDVLNMKIDSASKDTNTKIDVLNMKIDALSKDTNTKIDAVSKELNAKIDSSSKELNAKIDAVSKETDAKIDAVLKELNTKIDAVSDKIRPLELVYSGGIVVATSFVTFLALKIDWRLIQKFLKGNIHNSACYVC